MGGHGGRAARGGVGGAIRPARWYRAAMALDPTPSRATEPYRSTPLQVPPRGGSGQRLSSFAARRSRLGRAGLAAGAVLAAFAAGGCGFTAGPNSSVGGASVVDRSLEAVRFDVEAVLENPNTEDALELRTVDYRVVVDGVGTYEGLRAAQATIAPGSVTTLRLPVILSASDVAGRDTLDWRLDGEVLYVAPGAFAETLLDTGVRRPKVRVTGRGTVRLTVPDVAIPSPPSGNAATTPGD